jgi:hypothetical protein
MSNWLNESPCFDINIFSEIEFPDGKHYPVRFSVECERTDDGYVHDIGKPTWSEKFYDLAQNAIIRQFAESNEMKRFINEYLEKNF